MRFMVNVAAGLAAMLLAGGEARAEWWQAQSRHFTVYSEGKDETLRGFAERLEKFDFLLRTITGVEETRQGSPVQVFMLSNEDKVKKLVGNRNVAGFYSTSDRTAFAVLSRDRKLSKFDLGAEEVLFHEYTHHFMLHYFPAAYPAWYVEGFAEFFSVVQFPKDGSIKFGFVPMARAPGLVLGSPYPVKNLFARNADGLSLRDGDRYYGTAWLLTHYYQYNKGERHKEMSRYLNDVAKGVPDIDPDSYFAGGLDGLEKDLKAYMRSRLTGSMLKVSKAEPIAITPVDPARGAAIEDELRVINGRKTMDVADLAASLRATAGKYPDSAHVRALLAEAEWDAEQKDAALADADAAIALDPQNARAHAIRAQVLLERAHDSDKPEDWKAALSAIVKANRADTEDPVPLALFYRYHAMRGGKMPDLGYDGLHKAFTLLPQSSTYRMNLARAMAIRGEYKSASILLDPIAYSPHGSGLRDYALKMKAGLDERAAKKAAGGKVEDEGEDIVGDGPEEEE